MENTEASDSVPAQMDRNELEENRNSNEDDDDEFYNATKREVDLDNIGEFFFESDHLALKVNADYQNAIQCLAVLEAQRIRVIRDLDQLRLIKNEALKNPIGFVQSLQRKEDLGIPKAQRVASLPNVDWSKYSLKSGHLNFLNRPLRSTKFNFTPGFGPPDDFEDSNSLNKDDKTTLVRGRIYDKNKPATFNQLWTTEEQKRLEELLVLYPPEEVESKRWAKIAAELGNRTPTQVASRVQKYFIKLSRAGIPVPGRTPSFKYKLSQRLVYSRRPASTMAQKLSLLHSSTFFRHKFPTFFNLGGANDEPPLSHQVPKVTVRENDLVDNFSRTPSTPGSVCGKKESEEDLNELEDEEQEETIDDEGSEPEVREYLYLKKLKEAKLQSQGLAQHVGFKCDRCNCNPIIGTRWHCVDCPPNGSTDFCNDCVDCQHESFPHSANHNLQSVNQAESAKPFLDRDYVHFMGGDYNYLDPNYMPAT